MSKNRNNNRPQPTPTNQETQVQDNTTELQPTDEAVTQDTQEVVQNTATVEPAVVEEQQPVEQAPIVQSNQEEVHGFHLKGFPASQALTTLLGRVAATGNVGVRITIQGLFDYCYNMRPGATMNPQEGGIHQASLLRLFQAIIERSGNDFNIAMTTALKIVEDGRNLAFHDKYSMRFMENVTLNYDDQRAFERLLHLFKVMAPSQGRKDAAKQISFNRVLEYGVSQEGRTRIQNYFNV